MCSESSTTVAAGGGGSEVTNGIIARIIRSDGHPAVGACVRLRSEYFLAQSTGLGKSATYENAVTDTNGEFEIRGIGLGAHRIEINDNVSGAVLLSCSISASTHLLDLGVDTLRPFAAITGTLQGAAAGHSLQIYGMERSAQVDSTGSFAFSKLPGGIYRLVVTSNNNSASPVLLDLVTVAPGGIKNISATIAALNPLADAHVRGGGGAGINYGGEVQLTVKEALSTDLDYTRNAYLKFDVSGIATATKAVLIVYGKNMDDSLDVSLIIHGCDSDIWTEGGITWNNAPANSSTLDTVIVNGTAAYRELDVTRFVQAQIAGDHTVTLCITAKAESNKVVFLNSKESSANRPQLVITP